MQAGTKFLTFFQSSQSSSTKSPGKNNRIKRRCVECSHGCHRTAGNARGFSADRACLAGELAGGMINDMVLLAIWGRHSHFHSSFIQSQLMWWLRMFMRKKFPVAMARSWALEFRFSCRSRRHGGNGRPRRRGPSHRASRTGCKVRIGDPELHRCGEQVVAKGDVGETTRALIGCVVRYFEFIAPEAARALHGPTRPRSNVRQRAVFSLVFSRSTVSAGRWWVRW